jgi:hypothetical protein
MLPARLDLLTFVVEAITEVIVGKLYLQLTSRRIDYVFHHQWRLFRA